MNTATKWAAIAVAAGCTAAWVPAASAAGKTLQTAAGATVALTTEEPLSGPTKVGEICMQKVFGSPVTNSNRLNCTAGDIRIARATEVFPASCTAGTTFTLRATFEAVVTANVRYDAGFFFRLDGGSNARGDGGMAEGQCSLSAGSPDVPPSFNGDGDTCGDLVAGTHLLTFEIPNVSCEDPDGDGFLNLPNCTSWHSNQGTACNIDNAFDFDPDTKSKCACDDDFSVPVRVEPPSITVDKVATPSSVAETGAAVNFSVTISNDAQVVSAAITSIRDTLPDGSVVDLTTIPGCTGGTATAANPGPCTPASALVACPDLLGDSLGPQASLSCSFQIFVDGNAGETLTDTVEACVANDTGGACDSDDASVGITDVQTDPMVTKTATAVGCAIDATYQVVVDNPSLVDSLTLNTLTDDRFGSITTPHLAGNGFEQVVSTTCAAGGTIAAGGSGSYSCQFVGRINSGDCNINHTNTVTAGTTDDDGVSRSPSDSANVTVTTTKN